MPGGRRESMLSFARFTSHARAFMRAMPSPRLFRLLAHFLMNVLYRSNARIAWSLSGPARRTCRCGGAV
jgi:hypothetical protein